MAQLLVRDLDNEVVERLKARARRHGRSLEAELRQILGRAATADVVEARAVADRIRRQLSGREHSDSADLVAEDRER
ncbi:MAG: Arc family DNA-binding protein [Gemmatimonadetes bacterium]|nr:Arc family DNA-binding protein [Gemmatimonadota bacterium]NIR89557.1 Arc family DNA-binding protein [Gammaproteobacteria bacterium]NIT68609.1 Arc family DNA-binding protein [Gemmatimonadota bacterium]NIU52869.1 Arc family DNA-binding protein [Gemmatimonadota bacterium]NIW36667.1 Arc family DNA-binding protein [Gemmatimonadota bacterium]